MSFNFTLHRRLRQFSQCEGRLGAIYCKEWARDCLVNCLDLPLTFSYVENNTQFISKNHTIGQSQFYCFLWVKNTFYLGSNNEIFLNLQINFLKRSDGIGVLRLMQVPPIHEKFKVLVINWKTLSRRQSSYFIIFIIRLDINVTQVAKQAKPSSHGQRLVHLFFT